MISYLLEKVFPLDGTYLLTPAAQNGRNAEAVTSVPEVPEVRLGGTTALSQAGAQNVTSG